MKAGANLLRIQLHYLTRGYFYHLGSYHGKLHFVENFCVPGADEYLRDVTSFCPHKVTSLSPCTDKEAEAKVVTISRLPKHHYHVSLLSMTVIKYMR